MYGIVCVSSSWSCCTCLVVRTNRSFGCSTNPSFVWLLNIYSYGLLLLWIGRKHFALFLSAAARKDFRRREMDRLDLYMQYVYVLVVSVWTAQRWILLLCKKMKRDLRGFGVLPFQSRFQKACMNSVTKGVQRFPPPLSTCFQRFRIARLPSSPSWQHGDLSVPPCESSRTEQYVSPRAVGGGRVSSCWISNGGMDVISWSVLGHCPETAISVHATFELSFVPGVLSQRTAKKKKKKKRSARTRDELHRHCYEPHHHPWPNQESLRRTTRHCCRKLLIHDVPWYCC